MIKNVMPNIRTATLNDAEAIAQIHICSWQKMYRDFIPEIILQNLSLTERTRQWHDLIEQEVKVLVMEIHNQIIGFASICPFRDFSADGSMGKSVQFICIPITGGWDWVPNYARRQSLNLQIRDIKKYFYGYSRTIFKRENSMML